MATTSPNPPANASRLPSNVWAFVAFTGTVFGSGTLLIKRLVNDGVDPLTITWVPFVVGGFLALAVSKWRGDFVPSVLAPAALLGLVSITPAAFFNLGFEKLPAGTVTLLISLGPVVTAVIAHFVFDDERFNTIKAIGLATAVAGVGVLASGTLGGDGSGVAMVTVIVGTVIAGFGAVLTRQMTAKHNPAQMIGGQLLAGGFVVLAVAAVMKRQPGPDGGFALWHIAALVAFGVVTYLAFFSMLHAASIGTTGQVSIVGYFVPLLGVFGGIVVFHDPVTWQLIVGGSLILFAMTAIARGSS